MILDSSTVAFVGFVQSIGITLGFSVMLLVLRRQPALRLWTAALWVATVGSVFLGLRDQMPELLSILGGDACAAGANVLLLWGIATYVGQRPPLWQPLLPAALLMLAMLWFSAIQPNLILRLQIFSAFAVLFDLWICYLLLLRTPHDIRISCRIAALAFAADGANFLVRMTLPVNLTPDQNILRTGNPLAYSYLFGVALALAQCFSLVLLVVERLLVDLRNAARTDGLTGLPNRAALYADGEQALQLARQRRKPFALLIFDLDHFKQINDTWGHHAGDMVLQHFSRILCSFTRHGNNLSCRWGGEEFVLAMPGANMAAAMAMAEKLRQSVAATPLVVDGKSIAITTSVGVAFAGGEDDFDQILAQADAALYRAKAEGRNRITCAPLKAV